MIDATIVIGFLSLVGTVLGVYATYKATIRSKQIEAEATPYSVMADQLVKMHGEMEILRNRVNILEEDKDEDRRFMRRMVSYWPVGHPLPGPIPAWLTQHVPADLLDMDDNG